jgi:hypothetical protein
MDLEKKLTANQLYKIYKEEGGTLGFSAWLTREKSKGVFPLNSEINAEVNSIISQNKNEEMKKTILGFPVSTLLIVGVIIVGAVVASKYMKKK